MKEICLAGISVLWLTERRHTNLRISVYLLTSLINKKDLLVLVASYHLPDDSKNRCRFSFP